MKFFSAVLLSSFLFSSVACSLVSKESISIKIGDPSPVRVQAIGSEFDPHLYAQNFVGRDDSSKPEDWEIVERRVKAAKFHRFRVMIQPQWYEPYNDNDDPCDTDMTSFKWNTIEMQSLYKVLDLAQNQGIDVCLVIWGCPRYVSMIEPEFQDVTTSFLGDHDANSNWICPPSDNEEFGENFAALVKYLIEDKGYTCVKEVTPFNEPGGDVIDPKGYFKVCRALDSQFKRLGIRDKVVFNLADNIDTQQYYLKACADSLKDIAQIFNSHTYIFGYDTPNRKVLKWEKKNVRLSSRAGLEHLVGEFGSNQCVSASRQRDIDKFERGVLMTRHVLNFFNAGAAGVSYWGLVDQYYNYNASYDIMQQLGLWKYIKEAYASDTTYTKIKSDYECRPQYYAYTSLTRNIERGAEIFPLSLGRKFSAATAFRNPDGKWVYVIANQEENPLNISLRNVPDASFCVIEYVEGELPQDDSMLLPCKSISSKDAKLKIEVPAMSVAVISQE